jgi:hypothetical protein
VQRQTLATLPKIENIDKILPPSIRYSHEIQELIFLAPILLID